MSQENVERLKRAYAGDPDPDLLAPDFEPTRSAEEFIEAPDGEVVVLARASLKGSDP